MANSDVVRHFSNAGKLIALGAGIVALLALFVPAAAAAMPWVIVALAVAILLS